jgi:hypothetical protein
MPEARARVSLSSGDLLEFEGSEAFVTAQLDRFRHLIPGAAGPAEGAPATAAAAPNTPAASPPAPVFDDIFAATRKGVQILKAVPGGSRPQRSVNAARLYLFGLQALTGRDVASFDEIRAVCRSQRCYDASNMTTSLKNDQASFVFGGRTKRQTVKLSAAGADAARRLVERLRAHVERRQD